jgi:hypothetical protein
MCIDVASVVYACTRFRLSRFVRACRSLPCSMQCRRRTCVFGSRIRKVSRTISPNTQTVIPDILHASSRKTVVHAAEHVLMLGAITLPVILHTFCMTLYARITLKHCAMTTQNKKLRMRTQNKKFPVSYCAQTRHKLLASLTRAVLSNIT